MAIEKRSNRKDGAFAPSFSLPIVTLNPDIFHRADIGRSGRALGKGRVYHV
ncbi:MAG: hypothetical protein JW780_04825 [Clostridiales bacterium]|nr:hypothetical protein [Clostridiales bacterium]